MRVLDVIGTTAELSTDQCARAHVFALPVFSCFVCLFVFMCARARACVRACVRVCARVFACV